MDVIVAGAGGAGIVAAITVAQANLEVALFEKTGFLLGNTAASAGMIPACETRFQKEQNIEDSVELMVNDILMKNRFESDPNQVKALAKVSCSLVEWMNDSLNIEMSIVKEFKYPGHSALRMHAPPSRSGLELMKKLKKIVKDMDNIFLLLNSRLEQLIVNEKNEVIGVRVETRQGPQFIKGDKIIIATNGFGGNKQMVEKYIPEIADALYFGYLGNEGEGINAGREIGAEIGSLTAYQGHAAVNENTSLLVTWGTIMMGGFYVNINGERFGNEASGYSEFAKEVLKQPKKQGFIIYDERIHKSLQSIEDYKKIVEMEAYHTANTIEQLANLIQINSEILKETYLQYMIQNEGEADKFGRTEFGGKLEPPFYSIKVKPALFHTQGGLVINEHAEVLNVKGKVIPNLYAVGGSAVGISGNHAYGYMSGNGLLTAFGLGRIAGKHIINQLAQVKRGDQI